MRILAVIYWIAIVDYVAGHGKIKSSRETIMSEYKRLIESYYEIETASDKASQSTQ